MFSGALSYFDLKRPRTEGLVVAVGWIAPGGLGAGLVSRPGPRS